MSFAKKITNIFDDAGYFEEFKGLRIYPIIMRDYEEWIDAKSALALRMESLPPEYATMTYINAIYALEIQSVLAGSSLGILQKFAQLICLSLGVKTDKADKILSFKTDKNNPLILATVEIKLGNIGVELKPREVNRLREIIAKVNGEKLPDSAEDAELTTALMEKSQMGGMMLDINIYDLLDSVAYASGVRVSELKNWTVREFEHRRKTIDRAKRFAINAIAEGSGASWKNGNPVPNWQYDRLEGMYGSFTPISDLMGTLGSSEAWLRDQIDKSKN